MAHSNTSTIQFPYMSGEVIATHFENISGGRVSKDTKR